MNHYEYSTQQLTKPCVFCSNDAHEQWWLQQHGFQYVCWKCHAGFHRYGWYRRWNGFYEVRFAKGW